MTFQTRRDTVVVAASAGGIAALQSLVAGLPADLPAAVMIVTHLPTMAGGALPKILQRAGRLPVSFAEDSEVMRHGHVFVAPPNHHLLVIDGVLRLSQASRQHGCRPAADPLFFSAARSRGPRAIAVVLSGTLDDGAAGCAAVERHGGIVVVQNPEEAGYDGMPRAALAVTRKPLVAQVADIAKLLVLRTGEVITAEARVNDPDTNRRVAELLDMQLPRNGDPPGVFSGITCPECGGPIYREELAMPLWFECRIGHSWSARTLLEGQALNVERALSSAARQLEESAQLTRLLADQSAKHGHEYASKRYETANEGALRALETIRELLTVAGQTHPLPKDGEAEAPTI